MKLITVLKLGGDFSRDHVLRLRDQVYSHADIDFVCLTDCPETLKMDEAVTLLHGWPGWWSKIEIFRVIGPAIYVDLDTTVVGPLDSLVHVAAAQEFVVLRDFNPQQRLMGSGLMAWRGDMSFVYDQFVETGPERVMDACRTPENWGDQAWIEKVTAEHSGVTRRFWQDLRPGAVVSYKKHVAGRGVPAGARVVCFHGPPRPWQVPEVRVALEGR